MRKYLCSAFVSKPGLALVALWVVAACLIDARRLLVAETLPEQTGRPAPEALESLQWRELGPARFGGRITDFAVVEANPAIIYVATASGNLWKTTSAGAAWEPIFDDQGSGTIGAVALAPSDPSIVWVGTGEANNRNSVSWGDGVYKSADGGHTWVHKGLRESHHIGRIVIHPNDPDTVYVTAGGHLWGPNPERGVFRTRDGGRSWERVLYVDEDTGATDIVIDPANPRILIAAMYQRRRTAWGFNGGGPGSGIYRTIDGGATWERLTNGLPSGDKGRIGLDIYKGDGRLIYARVEAHASYGGVYRSRDGGDNWEHLNEFNPRPVYFGQIRIDPNDPERIYVGGRVLSISDDGGRTFRHDGDTNVHSDHHALWIDPSNSNHVLLGTDGGVYVSFDRSETWRMLDNLPIGQFYTVAVDMRDPYHVCGGTQDNGAWCGPSATRYGGGIGNEDWVNIIGADGFYVAIDPNDHRIVFVGSQYGNIRRVDLQTGERQDIRPSAVPAGAPGEGYRWNWMTPLLMSAHDSSTLYLGANMVLRSVDRGRSWSEISPDLTKQLDRSKLPIMGVHEDRMLSRHDGVAHYGTITTMSESPTNPAVLYAGTDDGNVQVTRDGGRTWTEHSANVIGVPERTPVSRLYASHHSESRVYVTFDGHWNADWAPHVYISDDFGNSWERIVDGLPDWSVRVIVEHPRNPDLLFLGTEIGVYSSVNRGKYWVRLKNNLPTVRVDDLLVHPRENDLVVGTHGRSFWILEDVGPLEELTTTVLAKSAHLFGPRRATIFNYSPAPLSHRIGTDPGPRYWNAGAWAAPNPPQGARIRYYLSGPAQKVRISVLDSSGTLLRQLEQQAGVGIQEIVWDLRLEPVEFVREDGSTRVMPGPRALPGNYVVRLDVDGVGEKRELDLRLDPQIRITVGALAARQQALLQIHHVAQRQALAVSRISGMAREGGTLHDDLKGFLQALERQFGAAMSVFGALDAAHVPPRPLDLRRIAYIEDETKMLIEGVDAALARRKVEENNIETAAGDDRLDRIVRPNFASEGDIR